MLRRVRWRAILVLGLCAVCCAGAAAAETMTNDANWGLAALGVCAVIATGILKMVPARNNSRVASVDDIARVYERIENVIRDSNEKFDKVYDRINSVVKNLGAVIQKVANGSIPRSECQLIQANITQSVSQLRKDIAGLSQQVEDLRRAIEQR